MIIITDIMVANIFFYIDIGCYDPCKYLLGSLTPLYYPLYTVHDINTNKKDFLVNIIAYLKWLAISNKSTFTWERKKVKITWFKIHNSNSYPKVKLG